MLVGGLNPSEKYESIGMMKFPIYGKIKNVPNHQPEYQVVMQVRVFNRLHLLICAENWKIAI